jgi:hypothetical protein
MGTPKEATDIALAGPQAALPAVRRDPLEVLLDAIESGSNPDTIQRLMDLQDRWETKAARKAFDAAIAAAKGEIGPIEKNKHVSFAAKNGGAKTDYWHEDLAEIARTVDPVLAQHGLSYRFRTMVAPNEPITVTCVLSHRDGHFEENTLSAGKDDSGNKNSIQQVGSTITYLQRYTLKASLGLSASKDDDGRTADAAPSTITPEQAAALNTRITALKGKLPKLLALFGIEKLEDLPADKYVVANAELDALQQMREQQAREKATA